MATDVTARCSGGIFHPKQQRIINGRSRRSPAAGGNGNN